MNEGGLLRKFKTGIRVQHPPENIYQQQRGETVTFGSSWATGKSFVQPSVDPKSDDDKKKKEKGDAKGNTILMVGLLGAALILIYYKK